MEPINNDDENTVRKLCAEANAERNRARLRQLRCRLGTFLHEHASLLTSMSEETYEALRQLTLGRSTARRFRG
jgi:hypothetical protein